MYLETYIVVSKEILWIGHFVVSTACSQCLPHLNQCQMSCHKKFLNVYFSK